MAVQAAFRFHFFKFQAFDKVCNEGNCIGKQVSAFGVLQRLPWLGLP
jgi:hypothetical protein